MTLPPITSTGRLPRNEYLDISKGVLMFLVVWGHMIQFIAYGDDMGYLQNPIFKAIFTFHMPLFMAISGYLTFGSIQKHAWFPMVMRRFKQLIVPAFVGSAIFCGIISITAILYHGANIRETLVHFPLFVFKTASTFWFLWAIFPFTLIIATLKTVRLDTALFMTIVFVIYLFLPPLGKDYLFRFTLPFFCIGYVLARVGIPSFVLKKSVGIAAAVISVGLYLLWSEDDYIYVSQMFINQANLPHILMRLVCGIIVSIAVLHGLSAVYKTPPLRVFSAIGKRSLEIYILHSLVLKLLPERALPLNPVVTAAVVAPVLALALCLLCSIGAGSPSRHSVSAPPAH